MSKPVPLVSPKSGVTTPNAANGKDAFAHAVKQTSNGQGASQANAPKLKIPIVPLDEPQEEPEAEPTQPQDSSGFSLFRCCCPCLAPSSSGQKQDSPKKKISVPSLIAPLSKKNQNKKTLVLDLDETLVHSSFEPVMKPDLKLDIVMNGVSFTIYVMYRPGVRQFLHRMARYYELIIFTASLKEYANPVIDDLDNTRVVEHRLFREHCTFDDDVYIKDISRLGRNMKDIIIIDNAELSYAYQPANGLLISDYRDEEDDDDLYTLTPFLEFLAQVYDIRAVEAWKERYEGSTKLTYNNMKNQVCQFSKAEQKEQIKSEQDFDAKELIKKISEAKSGEKPKRRTKARPGTMLGSPEIPQRRRAKGMTWHVPAGGVDEHQGKLKTFGRKYSDREASPNNPADSENVSDNNLSKKPEYKMNPHPAPKPDGTKT